MRAAGLEEVRFGVVPPPPALPPTALSLLLQVATVLKTQCVLISNPHSEQTELIELVRRRIAGYMTASRYVMITYNVHRAALKEVQPPLQNLSLDASPPFSQGGNPTPPPSLPCWTLVHLSLIPLPNPSPPSPFPSWRLVQLSLRGATPPLRTLAHLIASIILPT